MSTPVQLFASAAVKTKVPVGSHTTARRLARAVDALEQDLPDELAEGGLPCSASSSAPHFPAGTAPPASLGDGQRKFSVRASKSPAPTATQELTALLRRAVKALEQANAITASTQQRAASAVSKQRLHMTPLSVPLSPQLRSALSFSPKHATTPGSTTRAAARPAASPPAAGAPSAGPSAGDSSRRLEAHRQGVVTALQDAVSHHLNEREGAQLLLHEWVNAFNADAGHTAEAASVRGLRAEAHAAVRPSASTPALGLPPTATQSSASQPRRRASRSSAGGSAGLMASLLPSRGQLPAMPSTASLRSSASASSLPGHGTAVAARTAVQRRAAACSPGTMRVLQRDAATSPSTRLSSASASMQAELYCRRVLRWAGPLLDKARECMRKSDSAYRDDDAAAGVAHGDAASAAMGAAAPLLAAAAVVTLLRLCAPGGPLVRWRSLICTVVQCLAPTLWLNAVPQSSPVAVDGDSAEEPGDAGGSLALRAWLQPGGGQAPAARGQVRHAAAPDLALVDTATMLQLAAGPALAWEPTSATAAKQGSMPAAGAPGIHAPAQGAAQEPVQADLHRFTVAAAASTGAWAARFAAVAAERAQLTSLVAQLCNVLVSWERARQAEVHALNKAHNVLHHWRTALLRFSSTRRIEHLQAALSATQAELQRSLAGASASACSPMLSAAQSPKHNGSPSPVLSGGQAPDAFVPDAPRAPIPPGDVSLAMRQVQHWSAEDKQRLIAALQADTADVQ